MLLTLKTQQSFRSEKHNVFLLKKLIRSNDDKRMQSIDLIETHSYGVNKNLVCKKEGIKFNNIIKQYKNV